MPLVPNRPDTGFVAVNLYCDDSATFKQLPVNVRATQLAEACGLVMQVRPGGPAPAGAAAHGDNLTKYMYPVQ